MNIAMTATTTSIMAIITTIERQVTSLHQNRQINIRHIHIARNATDK